MAEEITFTMIKPGAVQHEYIGPILAMINESGFRIIALKYQRLRTKQAEIFYEVHKEKPFFRDLVNFMTSGPVVVAILQKENAIEDFRRLMGATDPELAEEGTIRKLFAENKERNAVHGSDSIDNANTESDLFFSKFERIYD